MALATGRACWLSGRRLAPGRSFYDFFAPCGNILAVLGLFHGSRAWENAAHGSGGVDYSALALTKGVAMRKYAALLMLVCGLGMFGIVGCEGDKKTTPTPTPAPTDKDKMSKDSSTTPAPAPADKGK